LKLKIELADCSTDFRSARRVELHSALAVPIGAINAVVAKALIRVIPVMTNVFFALRFAAAPATPQETHLGYSEQMKATTPAV
jgi:hypothetical protein